jgi:hypothetical protein
MQSIRLLTIIQLDRVAECEIQQDPYVHSNLDTLLNVVLDYLDLLMMGRVSLNTVNSIILQSSSRTV